MFQGFAPGVAVGAGAAGVAVGAGAAGVLAEEGVSLGEALGFALACFDL